LDGEGEKGNKGHPTKKEEEKTDKLLFTDSLPSKRIGDISRR
jgi:hypothetical protein